MNASRRSERKQHHLQLERAVLTILGLGAVSAVWLGIGLPGLPPLVGGHAAVEGQSMLIASRDAIGQRPAAAPAQQSPTVQSPRQHVLAAGRVRSQRPSALPIPRTPSAPTPRQAVAAKPSRPDAVAADSPPPRVAPAPPPAPPTPLPTPDSAQNAIDNVQKTIDSATASLPAGSDIEKTIQNASSTATNALPDLPPLSAPAGTLPPLEP